MKSLHRYQIDDVFVLAYDEYNSRAVDWVAWELQADHYHLRSIDFREDDIVIDIGAHIGLFSIYLAKRWPGLKVLAFEPFPANYKNCAENLRLNGVTNVLLSPKAIVNENRSLTMATDPYNSGGASALVQTFKSNGIVSSIPSMTLDEVFSFYAIKRCRLLKIDCEGMEYEILLGTRMFNKIEYLAGEFHESAFLRSQGWCPEQLHAYCGSFFAANRMAIQFNEIPD